MTATRSTLASDLQRLYKGLIKNYIISMVRHAQRNNPTVAIDTEDVYQDVITQCWRSMDPARLDACKVYLYKVCQTTVWTHLRKDVKNVYVMPLEDVDVEAIPGLPGHENVDRSMTRQQFLHQLRQVLREQPIQVRAMGRDNLHLGVVLDMELTETPRPIMKDILGCVDASLHNYRQRIYREGRTLAKEMRLSYQDL